MLLGVVSDTHGHRANTQNAVRMLDAMAIDLVLHCGDVGDAGIVELFAPWPSHFVAGNVDYDPQGLAAAVEAAGQHWHGEQGQLELLDRKITFLHGHDPLRFRDAVGSGEWDLVCYGHTHRREHHYEGPTLVLNPGAVFRANPHTIAVVELESSGPLVVHTVEI